MALKFVKIIFISKSLFYFAV